MLKRPTVCSACQKARTGVALDSRQRPDVVIVSVVAEQYPDLAKRNAKTSDIPFDQGSIPGQGAVRKNRTSL